MSKASDTITDALHARVKTLQDSPRNTAQGLFNHATADDILAFVEMTGILLAAANATINRLNLELTLKQSQEQKVKH